MAGILFTMRKLDEPYTANTIGYDEAICDAIRVIHIALNAQKVKP